MTSIASQGGMVDTSAPRACEGHSIAALTRITVAERAAHSSHEVAVAEREIRARAHEARQRLFALRRRRRIARDKYVWRMRKRASVFIGLGLALIVVFGLFSVILYAETSRTGGMSPGSAITLAIGFVLSAYGLALIVAGYAFHYGCEWGRRMMIDVLALGAAGCIATLVYIISKLPLMGLLMERPDLLVLVCMGLGALLTMTATFAYQAWRFSRTRCRAWCRLSINRRIGHTAAELRAMNP